jgi:hypothetical protein
VFPQIPTFNREKIDEDAHGETRASRRKIMKQMKLQAEFLQRLYLLNETVKSVAERAEVWAKEDGEAIPYGHRLVRSPLAKRVVRDLVYWSWDAARILREYTLDADPAAFQLLQDLSERSFKKPGGSGDADSCASEFQALNLKELNWAARTLVEIIDNVFGCVLFDPPLSLSPSPSQLRYGCDDITQYLRLLDGKLEEKLYWLGEILKDLGNIMAPDGEIVDGEDDKEPSICLDQFRIRRQGSVH